MVRYRQRSTLEGTILARQGPGRTRTLVERWGDGNDRVASAARAAEVVAVCDRLFPSSEHDSLIAPAGDVECVDGSIWACGVTATLIVRRAARFLRIPQHGGGHEPRAAAKAGYECAAAADGNDHNARLRCVCQQRGRQPLSTQRNRRVVPTLRPKECGASGWGPLHHRPGRGGPYKAVIGNPSPAKG